MQQDADNRKQSRSNVFLSALLVSGSISIPVRVRNLSARGALLDGGSLPSAGTNVGLLRGELFAQGEIAWLSNDQAGIKFSDEVKVGDWIKAIGHPAQQRVDAAFAALRTRRMPPIMSEAETPSLLSISEELDRVCDRLASSAPMSIELGEELVKLDALARLLEHIASLDGPPN